MDALGYNDFNYEGTRGDGLTYDFNVAVSGVPEDITGASFWFTGKQNLALPDNRAAFQASTSSGSILIVDGPGGKGQIQLTGAMTESLPATVLKLYCDLQMQKPGAEPETLAKGILTLYPDATIARNP